MQLEVKTIPYVEAEWFCKEIVRLINTEDNNAIITTVCEGLDISKHELPSCLWDLITELHLNQDVSGGDYFELQLFSETKINQEVKFSDSIAEGKLVRLLLDSYLHLLKEVKSSVGSDKVLIAAPKGTF